MNNAGVYMILNTQNGKRYVGSSVDLAHRWQRHTWELAQGVHGNYRLQKAWAFYGEDAFEFSVLEYVAANKKDLLGREQHYIDTICPEYNILRVAGSNLGFRHSRETRRRLKAAQWLRRLPRKMAQLRLITATIQAESNTLDPKDYLADVTLSRIN